MNALKYNGVECNCGWTGDTIGEFEEHAAEDCPEGGA